MYKILLVPTLLLILAGCTLGRGGDDFVSLYNAHVEQRIDTIADTMELTHRESEGALGLIVQIPEMLSGSFLSDVSMLQDKMNYSYQFMNPVLTIDSPAQSGTIRADELSVVSLGGNSKYLSYKNLSSTGLITEAMKTVFQKYNTTWLSMNKATEDMSSQERIIYAIAENVTQLKAADIKGYLTKYPIWKQTADLGMSGSLHVYAITLDQEHLSQLAETLLVDLAHTGMTLDQKESMAKTLSGITFSGTLAFDPKNPEIVEMYMSAIGETRVDMTYIAMKDHSSITIAQGDAMKLNADYVTLNDLHTLTMRAEEAGMEVGKIVFSSQMEGKSLKEFKIDGDIKGITFTLKHTRTTDGFIGKITAPIGTLDWSGKITDAKLTTLTLKGASPFGKIDMNLVPTGSDDMLAGPLKVVSGDQTFLDAQVGLGITAEKFRVILDITSDFLGGVKPHLEFFATTKSTKSSSQEISAPAESKSFQEFMTELSSAQ